DRCNADFEIWGVSGQQKALLARIEDVPRENGPLAGCTRPVDHFGIFIRPRIKRNYYRTRFTFPGPGTYDIRYYDIARVGNVINIPNSGNVAFYVETRLSINPFLGVNRCSPQLLNDPIDDACTNKLWTHNPGGYDADGDSLVYSLIACQEYDPERNITVPVVVNGFAMPDAAGGGTMTIDRRTGIVSWQTPQRIGVYNVAILIEEYRAGVRIGYVIRDMAIFVWPCRNDPPIIIAPADTCVFAGQTLQYNVVSYDPNVQDSLYFYLNNNMDYKPNGPFAVEVNPAVVVPATSFPVRARMPSQVVRTIRWTTGCEHVRNAHYQVDYHAHDNLRNDPTLTANKATVITVVARAVENLRAKPGSQRITLEWDAHECEQVVGYEIYRAETAPGPRDTACCRMPGAGHRRVAFVRGRTTTTYTDVGLRFGVRYCYRVVALFSDEARSCPSNDTCLRILRDLPVITNDSVRVTETQTGQIGVVWAKPDTSRIDKIAFPPPYTYRVRQAVEADGTPRNESVFDGSIPPLEFTTVSGTIAFPDTEFVATNLNTVAARYWHQIELYDAEGELVGRSEPASSVYLSSITADRAIRLRWTESVPWKNRRYEIHRAEQKDGPYQKIAEVASDAAPKPYRTYVDRGLQVGKQYCYFVRSVGSYEESGLKDPLFNDSNIICDIPTDTVAPCLPGKDSIFVRDDCQNFRFRLVWLRPDTLCGDDVDFFSIFYRRSARDEYRFLTQISARKPDGAVKDSIEFAPTGDLTRQPGCYAFNATDTLGNVSRMSADFCIDNCPVATLPNVFTPNGDGVNDVFRVVELRSVKSLKFRVFDRWGMLIAESNDPARLWDGKTASGKPVPVGQYYYAIEIIPDNLSGAPLTRTGSVTVLR
ncbi:MAG: gliding motility-associated C-terminal domain-containing protein, partial [Bacteroidia bacterium]|nr:gliding motility-associated C-terminal domain-containing protein [Bacteroidia bacterium]MDW8334159.1 gliding motility-associated C-terminal domain-containing protein [Bacteroidia bacterium]